MTWSQLASGLLTGKYNEGVPETSRAAMKGSTWLKDRLHTDEVKKQFTQIKELLLLADRQNCSAARFSEGVSSVLLGVSNTEQLLENLCSLRVLSLMTPPLIAQMDLLLGHKEEGAEEEGAEEEGDEEEDGEEEGGEEEELGSKAVKREHLESDR